MKIKPEIKIILLFFIAAWICQFFYYIPVCEDYMLSIWNRELIDSILTLYNKTGIRRSLGLVVNAPLCAAPLWLTNYILISMHLAVTILIYYICKLISRSDSFALVLALIVGVFPWGYGAVTYACGSYTIPHSILYLLGICVLLRHSVESKWPQWLVVCSSSICFFLCCIVGEHLVFAVALAGFLALAASDEGLTLKRIFQPWVLAPLFVTSIYIVLILITQSGSGLMDSHWRETSLKDSFNPRTLLSVWFYLWRNLLFFEPLFEWRALSLSLLDMGMIRVGIGCIFAVLGVLFLLTYSIKLTESNNVFNQSKSPWWSSSLGVSLMMMFSVSFVHALAGGYSATSRHQYVPILIFAIFAASVGARFDFIRKICYARHGLPTTILALLAVITTWVVVSINRIELKRYDDLCNFLAVNHPDAPFELSWEPRLNYLWPKMSPTTSTVFDSEYAINWNLRARGKKDVEIKQGESIKVVIKADGLKNIIVIESFQSSENN